MIQPVEITAKKIREAILDYKDVHPNVWEYRDDVIRPIVSELNRVSEYYDMRSMSWWTPIVFTMPSGEKDNYDLWSCTYVNVLRMIKLLNIVSTDEDMSLVVKCSGVDVDNHPFDGSKISKTWDGLDKAFKIQNVVGDSDLHGILNI